MIKLTNRSAPGGVPVHDYCAIESLDEFRAVAKRADVIWAVDLSKKDNQSIVFGERTLRDIITSRQGKWLNIVAFAVDFRTKQVEHLLAAVRTVKGHFEWNGEIHTVAKGEEPGSPLGDEHTERLESWTGWGMGKSHYKA